MKSVKVLLEFETTEGALISFKKCVASKSTHAAQKLYESWHFLARVNDMLPNHLLSLVGECGKCNELFVIKRSGSKFCSPECSQKARQLKYYNAKGKKLRQLRRRSRS